MVKTVDAGVLDALIVGAGMSGLLAAIKLRAAGFERLLIVEKSDGVGGTWRDNVYPGSGCDVPSHLYSYSFEPRPDWTYVFSRQKEILDYFEHCATKYDLRRHLLLNTRVTGARFDEASGLWTVTTGGRRKHVARNLIVGLGQLNVPAFPDIPGRDSFAGIAFHSARWRHDVELAGKNIACIGAGASAVQYIPEIAPQAKWLTVFQRTPNWILPRKDRAYSDLEKRWFARYPWFRKVHRFHIWAILESRFPAFRTGSWRSWTMKRMAQRHLEAQVADPELRRKLTPDYAIGCKRILVSDDYYPALQRGNVDLVTDLVARIEPDGVVTRGGRRVKADVIIWGTGFDTTRFAAPLAIAGRGGRTLAQAWSGGVEAMYGVTTTGFPNMFMLYGPNTNLGHNSIVYMMEAQVAYMMKLIEAQRDRKLRWLDVTPEAQERFNRWLQQDMAGNVFASGCDSWYMSASGKVTANWSGSSWGYVKRTRAAGLDDYTLEKAD